MNPKDVTEGILSTDVPDLISTNIFVGKTEIAGENESQFDALK